MPGPAAFVAAQKPKTNASPISDYDSYYKKQSDVSEAQILLDVGFLRGIKDIVGIEKCLTAYLRYHKKHAAPWMYEQLGVAMELNKRDPVAIKTQYGLGADLARNSKDPIALIAACDVLLAHKYYEIILPPPARKIVLGELVDQAMKAAPSRPQPILMSLLLAEQTKDPKRMADSAEAVLSLGWPGVDGIWRVEVANRVNALAKSLKSDGRDAEAKALLDQLPEMEARDVVIRLTWKNDAMLDLEVDEPLNATASHFEPRTVFGGAIVKEGRGKDPESVYVCPRGFPGEYVARIKVVYNDEKKPALFATLEIITHEGTPQEKIETKKVSLTKIEPVKFKLDKGRRTVVLPYEAPRTISAPSDEPAPARDVTKPKTPTPKKP